MKKTKPELLEQPIAVEQKPPFEATWWLIGLILGVGLLVASTVLAQQHSLSGWERTLLTAVNDWPDKLRLIF